MEEEGVVPLVELLDLRSLRDELGVDMVNRHKIVVAPLTALSMCGVVTFFWSSLTHCAFLEGPAIGSLSYCPLVEVRS